MHLSSFKTWTRSLALTAGVVLFALPTLAAQSYVVRYADAETNGNAILHVKQDLLRLYPQLRHRDLRVLNLQLVAKSYNGGATASARVGGWISGPRTIAGRPFDWSNGAVYTFDRVQFFHNGYEDVGPWQILLNGRVRTREVIVQIEDRTSHPVPRPPRPPGRNYTEIICQAIGNQPRFCAAPFAVRQVYLLQQYAGRPCIANYSFFANTSGVTVAHGCRGRFGIYGY